MGNKISNHVHDSGFTAIGEPLSGFGREGILVNPSDRDWTREVFVLCFGAELREYLGTC